jgi:adenylate cyclase class 2
MKAASRTTNSHETEIKLAASDVESARRLLRHAGFRVSKRRVFETNVVLDKPDAELRNTARLLRIREAGRAVTLTYKGPPVPGKHKSREELELSVPDAAAAMAIFDRLGFRPSTRYEKYRTEYRTAARGGGIATLDETPIGVFLELEGQPEWIDRTARKLGFAESDYITSSYGQLYREWCERTGTAAAAMVFDSRKRR